MSHILDLHAPWQQAIKKSASIKAQEEKSLHKYARVSVVLVARGSYLEALATLVSLLPQMLVREVVIIDCIQEPAFEDKIHSISQEYARISIVPGEKDLSLAKAYNLGRRQTISRYTLFMHTPGVVDDELITKMLTFGLAQKELWCVGMAQNGELDPLLHLMAKQPGVQSADMPHFLVSAVMPSCFLLSQELVLAMGPFDSKCSDANVLRDYCLRLHAMEVNIFSSNAFTLPRAINAKAEQMPMLPLSDQLKAWHHYYSKHFSQYKKHHRVALAIKLFAQSVCTRLQSGWMALKDALRTQKVK